MSLARVAVDVCKLVLNQWATAPPPCKAPQEDRFKTTGVCVVMFLVSIERVSRFVRRQRRTPLAREAIALHPLCPRISNQSLTYTSPISARVSLSIPLL